MLRNFIKYNNCLLNSCKWTIIYLWCLKNYQCWIIFFFKSINYNKLVCLILIESKFLKILWWSRKFNFIDSNLGIIDLHIDNKILKNTKIVSYWFLIRLYLIFYLFLFILIKILWWDKGIKFFHKMIIKSLILKYFLIVIL